MFKTTNQSVCFLRGIQALSSHMYTYHGMYVLLPCFVAMYGMVWYGMVCKYTKYVLQVFTVLIVEVYAVW